MLINYQIRQKKVYQSRFYSQKFDNRIAHMKISDLICDHILLRYHYRLITLYSMINSTTGKYCSVAFI